MESKTNKLEKTKDNTRYILRRNPIRAEEIKNNRDSKTEYIVKFTMGENLYLKEHQKAKSEAAQRRVKEKISKLRLKTIVSIKLEGVRL